MPKIIVDYETQIKQIVTWFDWEKVRRAMVALKWAWAGSEQEDYIPSMGEIVLSGIEYLKEVSKHNDSCCGSGGFVARNDDGYLSLAFVVSDWDYQLEE